MRKESRILGIDDGPFDKFGKNGSVLVVGALFRGGGFLDGFLSTDASVDESDATDKISSMILSSRFYPQIRAIMLKGIAVAGFNVVDIKALSRKTKIPVIVFMREKPDFSAIRNALKKVKCGKKKWALIRKAGRIHEVIIRHRGKEKKAYIQCSGIKKPEAEQFVRMSCTHSAIPEPLRAAHIIASGLIKGESRGKA
jgi:hypothetical protein